MGALQILWVVIIRLKIGIYIAVFIFKDIGGKGLRNLVGLR